MFAAVKITPLKSRSRFFPPRPQISFTPVLYKGKPLYYLVEMKASKEKPGWDLLQRLCISYRNGAIRWYSDSGSTGNMVTRGIQTDWLDSEW